MARLELVITGEDDGRRLSRVARGTLRMSSGQFSRAKYQGSILLDGVPAKADTTVCAGQRLIITVPELETYQPAPYALPLTITYEDEHLLIVDKPAPLPSVPSQSQRDGLTLENAVYSHLGCPKDFCYHPVNRLDKGTSGLMAVAKTAHAQQRLQAMLHTDLFIREYLAVCEGAPETMQGVIDAPLRKEDAATIRRIVAPDGQRAVTYYQVLEQHNSRSLIRLRLETGRTHQIRAHLCYLGCPVAGDFLYGRELDTLKGRFALHSCLLIVKHPITGERIECDSPLPQALQALLHA